MTTVQHAQLGTTGRKMTSDCVLHARLAAQLVTIDQSVFHASIDTIFMLIIASHVLPIASCVLMAPPVSHAPLEF
jgi:hypothetical protein